MTTHHAQTAPCTRTATALEFEAMTDTQAAIAMRHSIVQMGGTYIPRPATGHWGPVDHELSLLGVCASGPTLAAATRVWTKRALRIARTLEAEATHTPHQEDRT